MEIRKLIRICAGRSRDSLYEPCMSTYMRIVIKTAFDWLLVLREQEREAVAELLGMFSLLTAYIFADPGYYRLPGTCISRPPCL
jgi:hypothetical protein